MTGSERTALIEERNFLLESLRSLENEHVAGNLGDDEYRALSNEQTLETQREEKPPRSSRARSASRAKWAGVVAIFVLLAGVTLVAAADVRLPGQTTTGNLVEDTNTLLRTAGAQTAAGKPADALKTYDKVLAKDPANVQALAYRGWLIRLAGLPGEGLKSIDQAIGLSPNYPDAHFFRGLILLRDRADPAGAIPEFEKFLSSNPPPEMVSLVQQALDDARRQATGGS